MRLLQPHELATLMAQVAAEDAIWEGWEHDADFQRLLFDYGAYPKLLDRLLKDRGKVLRAQHMEGEACSVEIHQQKLQDMLATDCRLSDLVAYQLIEDVVLRTPVVRSNPVVVNEEWTYGALETSGHIVLEYSADALQVGLIWPMFINLLTLASNIRRPANMLLRAVRFLPPEPKITMMVWQHLASFCAHFLAAREMFLYNKKTQNIEGLPPISESLEIFLAGALMGTDL